MVSIRSKRAFKAIFNDGGVDDMISKVDSERVLVEQVARLIYRQDLNEEQQKLLNQVENLRVPIEGIAAGVKEVVDATRLAKEKQVLDWISLIQFGKQHDRAGLGRLVDTGKWLLDDRAFETGSAVNRRTTYSGFMEYPVLGIQSSLLWSSIGSNQ
jgi:response regulator RpfG family c-di-GMP phosphodiesterase